MRSRATFFTLLFAVSFFALPFFAHAAAIPWFGPIVPANCTAGFGMLVTVINNIIIVLLSIAIVFVAPLMIAYAGFLFVVNPTNPGGKEQAKSVLTNTIVGIVISLAAWMIVGAIMAVLYKDPSSGGSTWGTWEALMTSGGAGDGCLAQAGSGAVAPTEPVSGVQPVAPPPSKLLPLCPVSNTACGVSRIQLAAQMVNMNLSNAQKNTLSCIAMSESRGNPAICNGNACGTFQVMLSLTPLTGPSCSNYSVTDCTGPSACNAVGGKAKKATSAGCLSCIQNEKKAASDAQCNAQTALSMYGKSGYSPWTCAGCNANAAKCVQQYGG